MYISRGFDRATEGSPAGTEPEPPQTLEYLLIHDRLTSLERLSRLREILSDAEFAAEKDRILQLPSEELILRPARTRQGPSLIGRLCDWKVIALGVLLGLALAVFTRPDALIQAADRLSQLRV